MAIELAGKAYDDAQTEALRVRDTYIDSILLQLSVIRRESGNLDIVADCLDDIRRDVQRAIEVNNCLQMNKLDAYDMSPVRCACGRTHERRHTCICKG